MAGKRKMAATGFSKAQLALIQRLIKANNAVVEKRANARVKQANARALKAEQALAAIKKATREKPSRVVKPAARREKVARPALQPQAPARIVQAPLIAVKPLIKLTKSLTTFVELANERTRKALDEEVERLHAQGKSYREERLKTIEKSKKRGFGKYKPINLTKMKPPSTRGIPQNLKWKNGKPYNANTGKRLTKAQETRLLFAARYQSEFKKLEDSWKSLAEKDRGEFGRWKKGTGRGYHKAVSTMVTRDKVPESIALMRVAMRVALGRQWRDMGEFEREFEFS
jgi:hypothetical protein